MHFIVWRGSDDKNRRFYFGWGFIFDMVCKSHSVIFSDETMDLFKAALINNELYFAVELANKFIDDSDITDDFQVYLRLKKKETKDIRWQ